ncbi:MAG: hypothetical protein MRY77_08580 [Rhodobacteraceae bacterium]|nr:hypothetical protein [Paracoccaceae bacterium]
MTEAIDIPLGERGAIRVFTLDMHPEQAKFLREPGALAQVLGLDAIDMDQVEIFPVEDLEDLGLEGYLAEGCNVPSEQIAADRDRLQAITGYVLLIRSRAFDGQAVTLTPAQSITLVARYTERGTDWQAQPLQTASAAPFSAPRPSPREARAQARKIGATLFAVMMTLILVVVLMLVF